MARLKPVNFEDRMTLVEHLDELRTRIVTSVIVLVIAVALCFWQRDLLFEIANKPMPADFGPPLTLSPTEPFFITIKLAFYTGFLIALPVLLYQAYAFVLPALTNRERQAVLPFLFAAPVLFIGGAVFAYFLITPTALKFLLVTFPQEGLEPVLRAQEYYSFVVLTVMSVGVLFEIPIAVMAACRLGITTPQQLGRNRRYAILIIAVVAMLLPGQDPVTMIIAMTPLYVLFELSLLLARAFGKPPDDVQATTPAEAAQ